MRTKRAKGLKHLGSTGGRSSPTGASGTGREHAWARREVLKRGAALVAVGAAAGSVLGEGTASPASASTTTEPGGTAPAVVSLTDAPTIAVDASLGNDFRLTLGGDHTLGDPSNPTDGQQIIFQVTQGAGAPFTVTWGSAYQFSTGLPQPALSTDAGQTDVLGFIYDAANGSWLLAAVVTGFGQ